MIKTALNSKKTTILICMALGILAVFGWSMQKTQAAVSASVMYFIPANIDELDNTIAPVDLRAIDLQKSGFSSIQEIGYTSDWKVIEELINHGELDALMVHQTMQEVVNWDLIKDSFQHQGLIVAGIDMAGDELANLVGAPYLYESKRELLDNQNFDYFIYVVQISGEPDDVAQIIDSHLYGNSESGKIKSPAYIQGSSSHGYFSEDEDSIVRFLGLLDEKISEQRSESLGE
jgi:hypothetical protein